MVLRIFYERGFAGFEGNVILAKSKGFFKLQYVDISGDLHDLTYSDDEMETILTTSSLNGYSSVVLSFYAYAPYNKLDSTIMIDDPIISGDYNFRTGVINIDIEKSSITGWTDDISKLKGEGEWVMIVRRILFSNSRFLWISYPECFMNIVSRAVMNQN